MLTKKKVIWGFLLCFSPCALRAQMWQNFVKNPSFEQYKQLPKDLGELPQVTHWSSPTKGSPDYFNKKSQNPVTAVPRNKMGQTYARSGSGYAGFYAYTSRYSKRDFREYIQVDLKQPLIAGEQYCIKTWVYLAQSANRGLNGLGVMATRTPLLYNHEQPIEGAFTYLLRPTKGNLTERSWMEIRGTYKAVGGEMHLIIGNFLDDKSSKVTGAIEIDSFRNHNVDFAYYFIDDVCVTALSSNFDCDCGNFDEPGGAKRERIVADFRLGPMDYPLGQEIVMHGVKFERNKALILPSSNKELEELLALLQKNSSYEVEIIAHTDDRLSPQESQTLSKRRAKAIYDYLVASGIEEHRLSYRGFGQARPIALNDSKDGRERNERVEFKILKK
jgi:hypothetical protein